jgi:hypothetical protein
MVLYNSVRNHWVIFRFYSYMSRSSGWLRSAFILLVFALAGSAQVARIVPAEPVRFPGVADSNSPSHWADGKLVVFNSDGMPVRSEGDGMTSLGRVRAARFYSYDHAPLWIEATYRTPEGTLYAWYHHEVFLHCPDNPVSAPEIGALRSDDNGLTFHDLGIVVRAGHESNCGTRNRYFGGGNGDFTVIADQTNEYLYFHYSNYAGDASAQGVSVARMAIGHLDNPVGNVYKYFEGEWQQPGLGGLETPIFPATGSWDSESAEAFWGPGVHWNSHLGKFVMVMNHTCCSTDWAQEGIYISYNADPSQPLAWTVPERLIEGGGWYPMIMGIEEGGTDKLAGQVARLFMGSDSDWLIEFEP